MTPTSLTPRVTADHVIIDCNETLDTDFCPKGATVERIFFARSGTPLEVQFDHRKYFEHAGSDSTGFLSEDAKAISGANALLQQLGYTGEPLPADLGNKSAHHFTLVANDDFMSFTATKGWWTVNSLAVSGSLF